MSESTRRPPICSATIVAATRRIVEVRAGARADGGARASARPRMPSRAGRFRRRCRPTGAINVIAECKRRSPSQGVLRADYDPVAIAHGYAEAGAAAISVLTEPTFFDGSLEHLAAVRGGRRRADAAQGLHRVGYQLLEAKAAGADAVLLIVAALRPVELKVLHDHAVAAWTRRAGRGPRRDASSAIALDAGARIIGVNNRNLRTLEVDVHASEQLIARMPADVDRGQRERTEVGGRSRCACATLGYRAFLIGERFMTADGSWRRTTRICSTAAATQTTQRTQRSECSQTSKHHDSFLRVLRVLCVPSAWEEPDAREDLRHHAAGGCARRRWPPAPSALGFVFWPGSPRFIDPYRARAIAAIAAAVCDARSACSSNQPRDYVNGVASLVRLGAVQLHGDETPEFAAAIARPVIKALSRRIARRSAWPAPRRRCCSTRTIR